MPVNIMKKDRILVNLLSLIRCLFLYVPRTVFLRLLQCLVNALLVPASIIFIQKVIHSITYYVENGDLQIYIWMSLFIITIFINIISSNLDNYLRILMEKQLNENMTEVIFRKYQSIEYKCFEDTNIQNIISRVGSEPHLSLRDLFFDATSAISNVISIFSLFIIFTKFSIFFGSAYIIIITIMIIVDIKSTNFLNELYNEQSGEERKLNYYSELLSKTDSLMELKIFRAIDYIKVKWFNLNSKILKERVKKTIYAEKYKIISAITFFCWICLLYGFICYKLNKHTIEMSVFISLAVSVNNAINVSKQFASSISSITKKHYSVYYFNQFMQLSEMICGDKVLNHDTVTIEFKNVTFIYPNDEERIVLNDVSFKITNKEHIAIVGVNGAGKSTIIKLICGLYVPQKGEILINGINVRDYDVSKLNTIISVVFQDFCNYELTLRENIAFGDINKLYNDYELNSAMELGLAHDLEIPLDTKLGKIDEDGINLSGGQWQKVAISRACLADSAFIILDEPTASLDPIAESNLYKHFMKLSKYKGCIIVSHRLASARIADRILVFADGKVFEDGSHDALIVKNGLYSNMFTAQSSWYQNEKEIVYE